VNLPDDSVTATRRRGPELEDAILAAALAELVEGGYARFTIERVAERAGTSRHVIYRRWATRNELALRALLHDAERNRRPLPDTGSLRGDVIAMLSQANETRLGLVATFSVQLGTYFTETGTTPGQLREQILGGRARTMEVLVERAVARGEVDPARLTPRLVSLPSDLLRHEALMTLNPVSESTIIEIVDDIFLPLVLGRAEAAVSRE
jgi:AcrR family transcriptional regulator